MTYLHDMQGMMALVMAYTMVLCWTGPSPEEGSATHAVLRGATIALFGLCFAEACLKVSGFGLRCEQLMPSGA